MEKMIESGDADALQTLIEQASEARARWRIGPHRNS
jgi:hypothetical protein